MLLVLRLFALQYFWKLYGSYRLSPSSSYHPISLTYRSSRGLSINYADSKRGRLVSGNWQGSGETTPNPCRIEINNQNDLTQLHLAGWTHSRLKSFNLLYLFLVLNDAINKNNVAKAIHARVTLTFPLRLRSFKIAHKNNKLRPRLVCYPKCASLSSLFSLNFHKVNNGAWPLLTVIGKGRNVSVTSVFLDRCISPLQNIFVSCESRQPVDDWPISTVVMGRIKELWVRKVFRTKYNI